MSTDIERAFSRFKALKPELTDALSQPQNEADTRFKVLDRILIEVLGWKHESIHTEPPSPRGFIDYLLKLGEARNAFVIEAKRNGSLAPGGSAKGIQALTLSGVVLKPMIESVKQALEYAKDEGVPFAAVTDGSCWLFFRASRIDGRKPLEGKACGALSRGATSARVAVSPPMVGAARPASMVPSVS